MPRKNFVLNQKLTLFDLDHLISNEFSSEKDRTDTEKISGQKVKSSTESDCRCKMLG